MAYRTQTSIPAARLAPRPCTSCGRDEESCCVRCDQPFCAEHAPRDGACCATCEREAHGAWWINFAALLMPLTLLASVVLTMSLGFETSKTAMAIATVLTAALTGLVLIPLTVRALRRLAVARAARQRRPRRWPTRAQVEQSEEARAS